MVQQQSVLPGTNDLLELAASPVQVIEHPSWIAARETVLALVAAGPCVVVLLGPPGSGKTMLLRNLATTLDAQGRTACFLEFGDSQGEPGQADVVLVDEADRISPARLDQLSDPEHRARSLVLAAIPSAAERFCEIPGAIVVRLVPLSPDQACAFLAERLAQLELPVTCLTEAAWAGLVVHAQGVARLLIALLGLALFVAAEDGAEQVTDAHVEQAVAVRVGGGEEATLSEPDPASPDAPAFLAANPATNTAEDGVFRARPSRWRTAAAAVLATVCVLVPAALLTGSHYQETVRPGSDKAGTGAVTQAPRTAVADAKSEQIAGTTQVTAAPALPAPGTTSGPPVSQGAVSAASNEVASLPVTPPAPVASAPASTTPAIAREAPPSPVVAPIPAATGPATIASPAAPADQQTAAPAPIEVVSKPPPLPAGALIRVVLIYPRGDNAAAHRAQGLAQELRSDGVGVGDPFPVASRAAKRGISYYFAQDEDAAGEIGRRLGGDYGDGKLVRPRPGAGLPRPGTIEIAVGSH